MEILVYGTVQSASLLLVAIGFSLVYGISRLPNFAHGALYVFTGFVAWVLIEPLGLPFPAAALLALGASALLGAGVHVVLLRRIRGMEVSEVLATYALGLALLEGLRWGGFRGSTHALPPLVRGGVTILDVPLDYQRIAVVGAAVVVVAGLWLMTHRTRVGLALRAVAQDERAATMVGIDADRTATIAVAIGSALAGLAAILLLPLGIVVVQEGYKALISALAVCVVGGLGSWTGTVLASLLLGFSQYLAVAYGKPHWQMVIMISAIIGTLVLRPSGLLGRQAELEERV